MSAAEIAVTVRRGPIFKDPLLDLIDAGQKLHTRRCDIGKWKGVKKGDMLWIPEGLVKATRRHTWEAFYANPAALCKICPTERIRSGTYSARYRRDGLTVLPPYPWHWQRDTHPSIFCPKACARVWVRATADACEEPLQLITEEEAIKEGVRLGTLYYEGYRHPFMATDGTEPHFTSAKDCFAHLWDTINDVDGKRWDDKPQVVVLAFEQCPPPEESEPA